MAEVTEVDSQIGEHRREIDDLDARIIELLVRRAELSSTIQTIRLASGGPRTVLLREMDIMARYQDGLGAGGSRIAMDVLDLCRGEAR